MPHIDCPDCGHPFPYSIDVSTDQDLPGLARIVLDEDDFVSRFERHVALNPERHPSFATPVAD